MRPEKELLLNEIKQKIDTSSAMIVTAYKSLTPNAPWKLRDLLVKQGSIFEVVRKRVFLKAAEKAGIQFDSSVLNGHIGVVFVTPADATESAKIICKFSDENGGAVSLLCGHLEGKLISGSDLIAISKLPGLNDMRAMFIGLLTSPMSQMLSVVEAKIAESEQKS